MFLISYFVLVDDHDSFAEIAKKDENIFKTKFMQELFHVDWKFEQNPQ